MVNQHYRWDFIGLSTDQKPTPATSEKVVDGSTFYCSDTSKLYVFCKDTWYEKTVSGGGGGTSNFNDLSNRPKYNGSEMTSTTDIPEVKPYTAGDGIDLTNDVISATNTGKARELTTDDYNYPTNNPDGVALWLMPAGMYYSQSMKVYITNTYYVESGFYIVGRPSGYASRPILHLPIGSTAQGTIFVVGSTGIQIDSAEITTQIIDNLTSTSTNSALSANQGKVLKDLIDSIAIRGAGAPTTSTVGEVGQLYEDGTNGSLYQLKSIDITVTPNTYNWEEVGGGGGVNVVQTTGTSTTDVMSQNATTSMVFADPANRKQIQIGNGATNTSVTGVAIGESSRLNATGQSGVAIGSGVTAGPNCVSIGKGAGWWVAPGTISIGNLAVPSNSADNGIAIGTESYSGGAHSIALGSYSKTSVQGQMDISTTHTNNTYGYNNSQYRLLTGLYDPQSDHDAATKGYVDGLATMGTLSTTPTGTTVGTPGRLYTFDSGGGTYEVYLCVHDNGDDTYVWKQVSLT